MYSQGFRIFMKKKKFGITLIEYLENVVYAQDVKCRTENYVITKLLSKRV